MTVTAYIQQLTIFLGTVDPTAGYRGVVNTGGTRAITF
jgi:hypothetical protein